jgi:hypothetical protein
MRGERCETEGGWACGVVAAHKRHVARGPTQGLGAKGTRGAHVEHVAHVRDAGGVKAQRLVEVRRALPSRREGMRCGGERGGSRVAGGPVVWWRHDKRHARGKGPTQGLGAKGTRGERTKNMWYMSVTLEVSQPEMSALKFFNSLKSRLMSVMAETHQSAMGPYFAMAEAAFELNSVTAVFRASLVVKVSTMQAGGGGEGEGEGGGGEVDGGGTTGGGEGPLVQLPGAQPEP